MRNRVGMMTNLKIGVKDYFRSIIMYDEEPNVNDIVYIINVYDGRGFTPCYYKKRMKMAFDRGFMFKTKKEVIEKVKSLGW